MNEEMVQQMMAAAERLAAATETLDRVLGKLDAQQEMLNAKVDRIVAAVEENVTQTPERPQAEGTGTDFSSCTTRCCKSVPVPSAWGRSGVCVTFSSPAATIRSTFAFSISCCASSFPNTRSSVSVAAASRSAAAIICCTISSFIRLPSLVCYAFQFATRSPSPEPDKDPASPHASGLPLLTQARSTFSATRLYPAVAPPPP